MHSRFRKKLLNDCKEKLKKLQLQDKNPTPEIKREDTPKKPTPSPSPPASSPPKSKPDTPVSDKG
jgi:hypothetical protein